MKGVAERWTMRLKESRTVLTVFMWGGILVLNIVQTLKGFLSTWATVSAVAATVFGGILFSYFYPEYVMKGEEKERRFRKDNFVDPKLVMMERIDVAQMAVQSKAIAQDWSIEKTRERLAEVTDEEMEAMLEGVDMSEVEQ